MLGLFNLLSSLLEEKVLILKAFLRERKFDLREILNGRLRRCHKNGDIVHLSHCTKIKEMLKTVTIIGVLSYLVT